MSQGSADDEYSTNAVAGSRLQPFRISIIGAGPAGTALVVRAIQLGFASELLSQMSPLPDNNAQNIDRCGGLCMFDRAEATRFGGGRLQDYKINSNTAGGKFVSNLIEDRSSHLPPERATGTILENLGKSLIAQTLLDQKEGTAPLDDIGQFLTEVGESIKQTIERHHRTSAYHCDTEVTRIQQMPDTNIWKITALHIPTKVMFETYSVAVVLATGGVQAVPRLPSAAFFKKVMTSDHVCTQAGIHELTDRMKSVARKRVVIIGGSHSAFSAAWICLNKLGWSKVPDSPEIGGISPVLAPPHSLYIIHRTPIKVYYATKKEADKDKYSGYTLTKQGQIHPFSGLRGDAKELFKNIKSGVETRVRLLALGADGGAHQTMYTRLCEEAHVIIWSCGYEANTPYDIVNEDGRSIQILKVRGQVELDDQARVLATSLGSTPCSPYPVQNLFATGLGFGLNVIGDTQETVSSKADGVEVYLKRGATIILSHILGTKVFGDGCLTWDQHCAENWKRILATQTKKRVENRGVSAADVVCEDDSDCGKVFASPASSRKFGAHTSTTSPPAGSPIASSPVRRNAKTAEPRSRRVQGVYSLGSPDRDTDKGYPLKIPSSPVRNVATARYSESSGKYTRKFRSVSNGNSLSNGGGKNDMLKRESSIEEESVSHLQTGDMKTPLSFSVPSLNDTAQHALFSPQYMHIEDKLDTTSPTPYYDTDCKDNDTQDCTQNMTAEIPANLPLADQHWCREMTSLKQLDAGNVTRNDLLFVSDCLIPSEGGQSPTCKSDDKDDCQPRDAPATVISEEVQSMDNAIQSTSPIRRPVLLHDKNYLSGNTSVNHSGPSNSGILKAENRSKHSPQMEAATKLKISSSAMQSRSIESSKGLVVAGQRALVGSAKRTLPNIPQTAESLKTVKKLVVTKNTVNMSLQVHNRLGK